MNTTVIRHKTLLALALAPALALATASVASAEGAERATSRLPEVIALPDRFAPEGIAAGRGAEIFVGSLADGSIYRADVRTGEGEIFVPGREGAVAVGMQFDARTGWLWVAGGPTGTVTAYDGRTGETVVVYTAPEAEGGRLLNDVEVTRDGVFVTDSFNAELIVVRTDRPRALPDDVELVPLTGDWDQEPGFNANGIREVRGGDLLVVDQGDLLRVDPGTGVADRLEQTGGPTLTDGDGLELRGSTLYVVGGLDSDSVAVVDLERRGTSFSVAGELVDDDLERPTTGALVRGALYVVNGKFETPDAAEFEVVRLALRGAH